LAGNLKRQKIMENDNEKMIDYLEKHIPEMAQAAVKQAYWQALASGSSVLVGENGVINEVFPDGTVKFVKNIDFVDETVIDGTSE
jgi:hypothetical protein